MLGAIAGDIIGSVYEMAPIRSKRFPLFCDDCRFTDDTVCTVAVAESLRRGLPFTQSLRAHVQRHPDRGYGALFRDWAMRDDKPSYGSWGNGAPMRVSAIGFVAASLTQASDFAAASAVVSHDHPDAVAGARAVATAIWLARSGMPAGEIRTWIAARFGYRMEEPVDRIRARYDFDVSAAGTVPPALICAIEAHDYEDAVRNAVSLGGDSDTLACIAGGLAEALYGLPDAIGDTAGRYLTPDLLHAVRAFYAVCPAPARNGSPP